MDVPKDENPAALTSFVGIILGYLSAYGWHILFFAVIANLIWSHVRPKLQKWQEKRRDQQWESEFQQNPERLLMLQEGLERSRRRLQEEHDRKAREYAEKQKQLEEEKRQEKIKKWECVQKGRSLKPESSDPVPDSSETPRPKSKGERLRGQDYNPLMGAGGGTSYRSSRSFGGRAGG